jgi:hypothetical protein
VSRRPPQRTRPYTWRNSASAITTPEPLSTADPLMSMQTVPTPTLSLVFGGPADGAIAVVSTLSPPPMPMLPATRNPSLDPVDQAPDAHANPHRIELSIDSLPNVLLVEPIPVAIDPVDDDAFTAWVLNLDINATGQSVVEALLMLKERIELVYDDLNRRPQLTIEQKTTLQMLHAYITPKKPEWV